MSIERLADCMPGNHPIHKVVVEVSEDQDGVYCNIIDERLSKELGETGYLIIGPSIRNNCILLFFCEKKWELTKKRMAEIEKTRSKSSQGTSLIRYLLANVAKCDLTGGKLRVPYILADYIKLKPGSPAEIVIDKSS